MGYGSRTLSILNDYYKVEEVGLPLHEYQDVQIVGGIGCSIDSKSNCSPLFMKIEKSSSVI